MDAVFYWDMTYGEIISAIEGNQRRTKLDMQIQAKMVHQLGTLVGIAFHNNKKYPTIQKVFPELFDEEKENKQQDWLVMKERINRFKNLKKKRGEE